MYVLDTNIISALARNPRGSVAKRIAEVGADAIGVGAVTADEPRYGCAKKKSRKPAAQIEVIPGTLTVLALDASADAEYGGIRAELEAIGKTIGPNDLLRLRVGCCAGDSERARVQQSSRAES